MSQHSSTMMVKDDNGSIYLDKERVIITSSSVFGTLRKDLIKNIGLDRMKGFLIRYGWNLGVNDANRVQEQPFSSIREILSQGPILHMMKGYTKVKTTYLHIDQKADGTVKSVHVAGDWLSSYEAEEHLTQSGPADQPICYTLIGYASGYYSSICGHTVIFKEQSCKANGAQACHYIGKSLHDWDDAIVAELPYYENHTIVDELEQTYENLLEERNNLSTTLTLHKLLMEELTKGSDLPSIAKLLYEKTRIPILIEDADHKPLAILGLDEIAALERQSIGQTELFEYAEYKRMITPIRLEKRTFGYCSFIYQKGEKQPAVVDEMILERVATTCSLFMLNEKTSFEAMERMKGHFLEQILNGQYQAISDVMQKGRYLNIHLDRPYHILALRYVRKSSSADNELLFHEQLLAYIFKYFQRDDGTLIGQRNGQIIFFMQPSQTESMKEHSLRLLRVVQKSFPSIRLKLGMSARGEDIGKAAAHYEESLTSLSLATSSQPFVSFEEVGVVGMLIQASGSGTILQKARGTLEPLATYKNDQLSLLKTLYYFLANACNLEKTMEDLSLSMSGLRYRVKKIETLLGKDVRDPSIGYQLYLTLQILIVNGELEIF